MVPHKQTVLDDMRIEFGIGDFPVSDELLPPMPASTAFPELPPMPSFDKASMREKNAVTMFHKETGNYVKIEKDVVLKLDKQQMKDYAQRGRLLIVDSSTGKPVTEFEGVPLPSLDSMIRTRVARLQNKREVQPKALDSQEIESKAVVPE